MTKPPCCNHDCTQGRTCPLQPHPWWAELLVGAAYLLVAIIAVAIAIYGGAMAAGHLLTIYPIAK